MMKLNIELDFNADLYIPNKEQVLRNIMPKIYGNITAGAYAGGINELFWIEEDDMRHEEIEQGVEGSWHAVFEE